MKLKPFKGFFLYIFFDIINMVIEMIKKKKDELDVENLNKLILLGKKLVKVVLVLTILSSVFLGILVLSKLKVAGTLVDVLMVASPFFIGYVLAWLLNPLVTRLEKKKIGRVLGSIIVFLLFLVLIFLIIKVMIPMLYEQINDFIGIIPGLFDSFSDYLQRIFEKLDGTGIDFSGIEEKVNDMLEQLGANVTKQLPSSIIDGVGSIVSSIWQVLLGLIIGFYLLIDFDKMGKIFDILPRKYQKSVKKVALEIDATCKNFVQGSLFISFIIFVITSSFFAIIGLPSPMLFGLICGITNLIPYIGPWIGGAIAAIVGFTVSPLVGILSIIVAFAAQQIDGLILQPLIMSKTMKLHPVTIMIGLLVFEYFFGVIGMIVATPVIACMKVLIVHFIEKYDLKEKMKNVGVKGA